MICPGHYLIITYSTRHTFVVEYVIYKNMIIHLMNALGFVNLHNLYRFLNFLDKGQLISKCPFGVIVWTKIPTKKFPRFLP